LKQLVKTDFMIRYQNSILGYLWSLLRPLFLFCILYVVFVKILKTGGDVPHFGVYLLLGIVLWNYFIEATVGSVASIVGKGDLMRKVNFPRYVVVLAGSFSAFINLIFNLIVVSFFMWLGHAEPNRFALFFPLIIAELFIFALSISFILSAAYVRFRDVGYIWEVLVQVGFYATPILYAFSYIADKSMLIAKLVLMNPLAQMIQDARHGLITNKTATIYSIFHNYNYYIVPISIVILIGSISVVFFKKMSPHFAEDV
jgi:ABC-2 type transport system permease protein